MDILHYLDLRVKLSIIRSTYQVLLSLLFSLLTVAHTVFLFVIFFHKKSSKIEEMSSKISKPLDLPETTQYLSTPSGIVFFFLFAKDCPPSRKADSQSLKAVTYTHMLSQVMCLDSVFHSGNMDAG